MLYLFVPDDGTARQQQSWLYTLLLLLDQCGIGCNTIWILCSLHLLGAPPTCNGADTVMFYCQVDVEI